MRQAAENAAVPAALRDAWVIARLQSGNLSALERITITHTIQDPIWRRQHLEMLLYPSGITRVEWRDAIARAAIEDEERQKLLQGLAAKEGKFYAHRKGKDGGTAKASQAPMDMTLNIISPEIRFMRQRSIVHELAWTDVEEARSLIASTDLDLPTQIRLMEECEKLRTWYRFVPSE